MTRMTSLTKSTVDDAKSTSTRRREQHMAYHSSESGYSSEDNNSDGEAEWVSSLKSQEKGISKKRKRTPLKKDVKLSTKAEISILATAMVNEQQDDTKEKLEKAGSATIALIKKMLALANHQGTSENEAKQALRNASKHMSKHNLTQADVMANETAEEKVKRAGMSVVKICRTDPTSKAMVPRDSWTSTLGTAMNRFFDCQHYTTRYKNSGRVEFAFYGLAEQTVAAAVAFEMAYNLILTWSLEKNNIKGKHAKNAYRIGAAKGLWDVAIQEKEAETKKTIENEKRLLLERQKQEEEEDVKRIRRLRNPSVKLEDIDRTVRTKEVKQKTTLEEADQKVKIEDAESNALPTEKHEEQKKARIEEVDEEDKPIYHTWNNSSHDSDDGNGPFQEVNIDINNVFTVPNFDSESESELDDYDEDNHSFGPILQITPIFPPEPPTTKEKSDREEAVEADDDSGWISHAQLIAFRKSTVAIGDDYIKAQGVKLTKASKRPKFHFKDKEACESYNQGKEDAKNIDVKRRRIKGPEDDC